ncbi:MULTISPECIES: hypothetical protein [unclassified Prochlorococcus]|uniref:hypothetical protein n=1 Tax=unclassified Prochlorococcus TaxID=2627481 RepID=UPI000533882E|nr:MULTISPECIES: hypothetical protein [unclassified Prochlorococcus]KGG27764.1 hypothetical protein EV13_1882 [Prochlorococcus sp. MIT 0702]KGG29641.1 hypothetical protein EV12_0051 [Prochlorococcus sp. MIT 0701]KGG34358.1 hypothetical protein EV14_1253 [Prochlorococcus sp. MIT 0703]
MSLNLSSIEQYCLHHHQTDHNLVIGGRHKLTLLITLVVARAPEGASSRPAMGALSLPVCN